MAAPPQAPSPAESETRDHGQSVTSVVEPHNLVHLQHCKCEPPSCPEPSARSELQRLDLHSSDSTSQISLSGHPTRTYRDEEFTGPVVGSIPRMEPEYFVKGSPLSTRCDVYSLGLVIFAVLTNYYRFLNESEASLSLNASTETPIHHRPEGGLVYSGGPSHPAAAEESSTTPPWHVASSAANHMTGDASQLTDGTPAPADLAVQVPSMGSRRVHSIGALRTATMSLQNVYYVPGLDKNLVSSSQLAKLGYTITLGPSECRVTKNDQGQTLVGKAHFTDDYLFELDFLRVPPSTN